MKIIAGLAQSRELILSPGFRTYSMADKYRELSRRMDLDFSATIRLLEHLPIFMDGPFHADVRKAMAKQISRTQGCQFRAVADVVDRVVAAQCNPGQRVDLVEDFSRPIWRAISNAIVPRDALELQLTDDIPGLFFATLSVRARLDIEARLKSFLETHRHDQQDQLILLCLAVLGARPFLGSIALSLYHVMEANAGKRLSDMDWPEIFPQSALRYVDRIHGGIDGSVVAGFGKDERVRCVTQSPDWTALENRQGLFGFGSHTCIGKSVSEKTWKMITARLSQVPLQACVEGLAISAHVEPFHMPESARIRFM